jgi:hypothetical protein
MMRGSFIKGEGRYMSARTMPVMLHDDTEEDLVRAERK